MNIKKLFLIITYILLGQIAFAQVDSFGLPGTEDLNPDAINNEDNTSLEQDKVKKDTIQSIIKVWTVKNDGASFVNAELDTAVTFHNLYNPLLKNDLSPITTGNMGGAHQYSNFFNRKYKSDFLFSNSVDAYMESPSTIKFFNTTTPYSVLNYVQNENKSKRNETVFNVIHTQNVNENFNFQFFMNSDNSTGFYQSQANKINTTGLLTTFRKEKFNSHISFLSNRHRSEENGGLAPDQGGLNEYDETETYIVNITNANSEVRNTNFSAINEYVIGKNQETSGDDGYIYESFRPIVGFLYKAEYSRNYRLFKESAANTDFFEHTYYDSTSTADSVFYGRFTNILQIKFYENKDRKYTFSKRAYIGNDIIRTSIYNIEKSSASNDKYHNTYIGGGIARENDSFLKFNVSGRMYFTGYKTGQTELNGYIEKPLKIGQDTTTLTINAELNTIVPDYFQENYVSNHYVWKNNFNNINEMKINGSVTSQKYKTTLGFNYALIGNYIYNNSTVTPEQITGELLVLSAYLNKDFVSKHWFIRARLQWQESNRSALQLPQITGYLSTNWKFMLAQVLHNNIGFDVRYTTEYFADKYDPATGMYHWQNSQKIGNYPVTSVYYNLKLKRARLFFQLLNVTSGLLNGNYWASPDYPLYRRAFRFGVSWSFYD